MRALVPLALLAAPALADPDPAVESVLETGLEEQRLLAACLGLAPDVTARRAALWAEATEQTVEALERGGYDAEAIVRFRGAAAAVDPPPDALYTQVRDLCWTRAEEVDDLYARWSATFRVTTLPEALPAPYAPKDE